MKYIFVGVILFGLSVWGVSQSFTKSKEPFTAYDGTVFKVGDKIVVGTPKVRGSNKYSYYFFGNSLASNVAVVTVSSEGVRRDRTFSQETIKLFKVFNGVTYAVTSKLFNEQVDINQALKAREIYSKEKINEFVSMLTPSKDSLFYKQYLIRQGEFEKDKIKEFLYLFRKDYYNFVREDEFEFHRAISKTRTELKAEKIDSLKNYTIGLVFNIGNYDFEKEGFPIIWLEQPVVSVLESKPKYATPSDLNRERISLTDLNLAFENVERFSFFKMNPEDANLFIKYRKNDDGDVDRSVKLYVRFQITGLDNSYQKKIKKYSFAMTEIKNTSQYLSVRINKAMVFEDGSRYVITIE